MTLPYPEFPSLLDEATQSQIARLEPDLSMICEGDTFSFRFSAVRGLFIQQSSLKECVSSS